MSAKEMFLKKLQGQKQSCGSYKTKGEADIAEFCRRMAELQADAERWLIGSGLRIEGTEVTLTELLIGGAAFSVPGFQVCFENRVIAFIPAFLYGQGVTGGADVTLGVDGKKRPLCRLFMRSAEHADWSYTLAGMPAGRWRAFGEDAFFEMIDSLLP
jgi:hypothetical protein